MLEKVEVGVPNTGTKSVPESGGIEVGGAREDKLDRRGDDGEVIGMRAKGSMKLFGFFMCFAAEDIVIGFRGACAKD